MSARPPPARPHIGLNPANRFGSYSISDWGEDDAWDSGSDEEASGPTWRQSQTRAASSTAPKPVPKPQQNSSSSTLASSYTHVNAPSPSSYPPRIEQPQPQPQTSRQGWTIISNSREDADQGKHNGQKQHPDVDGDLIVGDLDPEELPGEDQLVQQVRPTKHDSQQSAAATIRADVDDIVKGTSIAVLFPSYAPLTCG